MVRNQRGSICAKILIPIALLFGLMTCIGLCAPKSNTTPEKRNATEFNAYVMSQVFVKKHLKAPSTADFASFSEAKILREPNNKFTVVSYVDAENSFGAKLRNHYRCELVYDGIDNWILVNFQMNE